MKDQKDHSPRVHRHNQAQRRKQARKRKKRPCRSAPSAPTSLVLRFNKRHERRQKDWRAVARFDPVTTDAAGRDLDPETYEVELRATDASGDPVETQGQADSSATYGEAFTVHTGTAAVGTGDARKARELNASPDVIKTNLTSLTTGIDVSVDFWLEKDLGGSSPTVRCLVWNVTDGVETTGKNGSPDSANRPKLTVTRSFTPVAGKSYEARVQWVSGTGIALVHQVQWRDKGDEAVWHQRFAGDRNPPRAYFPDIPKPASWYYACRARAMNRVAGARCWSAWTAWTTPTNPVTGNPTGPPAPDGLTVAFVRTEARKHNAFQLVATWNETPWWIAPDGEAEEGATGYGIKLGVSEDGSTTVRTRHARIVAKDADTDTTSTYAWTNIRRRRYYRVAVRATRGERVGAWSAWSAWRRVQDDLTTTIQPATNVVQTKLRPGHFKVTWDPPATNPEETEKYRIRVYAGGVLKDTSYTRSEVFRYAVPDADRGTAHRFKVTAVDEDQNISAEVDMGSDTTDDPDAGVGDAFEVGDIRKLSHTSIATWITGHPKWLKADGTGYSTTGTYAPLFAVIGYTYGGGGATFNVPDLKGRHAVGVSSAYAVGANDGIAEASRSMAHQHATDSTSATPSNDATNDGTTDLTGQTPAGDFTAEASHSHAIGGAQTGGPSGTNNNMTAGGGTTYPTPAHTHTMAGFVTLKVARATITGTATARTATATATRTATTTATAPTATGTYTTTRPDPTSGSTFVIKAVA